MTRNSIWGRRGPRSPGVSESSPSRAGRESPSPPPGVLRGAGDTFASMAVTFSRGAGATPAFLDSHIFGGTAIGAALAAG